MTDKTEKSDSLAIQFHPAPGYCLCKPLTRDEVSNSQTTLKLTDSAGKEKDSVGVARVIEAGTPRTGYWKGEFKGEPDWLGVAVKPGDLVAYMPFTDMIILQGYDKLNLVAYKHIVAVSQVTVQDDVIPESGSENGSEGS